MGNIFGGFVGFVPNRLGRTRHNVRGKVAPNDGTDTEKQRAINAKIRFILPPSVNLPNSLFEHCGRLQTLFQRELIDAEALA